MAALGGRLAARMPDVLARVPWEEVAAGDDPDAALDAQVWNERWVGARAAAETLVGLLAGTAGDDSDHQHGLAQLARQSAQHQFPVPLLTRLILWVRDAVWSVLAEDVQEQGIPLEVSRSAQAALAAQADKLLVDLAEHLAAELDKAHTQVRQLALIVQSSADGIVGTTTEGVVTSWNHGAAQLFGIDAEQIVGQSVFRLVPCRLHRETRLHLSQLSQGSPVSAYETERLRGDGSVVIVSLSATPLRDAAGRIVGTAAIYRDVTERRQLHERLESLAFRDPLTGLLNRRAFTAHVESWSSGSRDAAGLLFVDLDGFKAVNDSLGHAVGDELLAAAAARLAGAIRTQDTAGRLGGDEFAIFVPHAGEPPGFVERLARRLVEAMRTPFLVDGQQLYVRCSVGVALGTPGEPGASLLGNADIAMYVAKRRGGDRFVAYQPRMRERIDNDRRLLEDLHSAMGDDQILLVYQPIAEASTGALVGVEALARWTHPVRGPVPPSQFIPLAEQAGLMPALGGRLLDRALGDLAAFQLDNDCAGLMLSVNVSAHQLVVPGFVGQVVEALARHRIPASQLTLEITESMATQAGVVQTLEDLHACGVHLSIDDFGTGYASLDRLRYFPVDEVKIDRTFLKEAPGQEHPTLFVAGIVALAHTLGLRVVAEDIESPAQLADLQAIDCDRIQGYLLARPAPLDELRDNLVCPRRTRPRLRPVVPEGPGDCRADPPGSARRLLRYVLEQLRQLSQVPAVSLTAFPSGALVARAAAAGGVLPGRERRATRGSPTADQAPLGSPGAAGCPPRWVIPAVDVGIPVIGPGGGRLGTLWVTEESACCLPGRVATLCQIFAAVVGRLLEDPAADLASTLRG